MSIFNQSFYALNPRNRHSFRLLLLGSVKIKYIALFYFVSDFLGIAGANSGGHIAHIGGAVFGFVFIKQLQKGNDWSAPLEDFCARLFTKRPKLKVVAKNEKTTQATTHVNQAEIDSILDKIAASGYDNLTAKEKETLFRASK